MTLSEIETILGELTARHPNLDESMLTTLLVSAGWEDKTIKEVMLLFRTKPVLPRSSNNTATNETVPKNEVSGSVSNGIDVPPLPSASDGITFYQPDGTEEGELHVFENVSNKDEGNKKIEVSTDTGPTIINQILTPLSNINIINDLPKSEGVVPGTIVSPGDPKKNEDVEVKREQEIKNSEAIQLQNSSTQEKDNVIVRDVPMDISKVEIPVLSHAPVVSAPAPVTKEPESLITHIEEVSERKPTKESDIPHNLPLLPFESSPHVWSFSSYKEKFHGDVMPKKEEINVVQSGKTGDSKNKSSEVDEEVVLEKTPLNIEDKSLVFLASAMLLAIILILGYMYSNGRL